jgi:pyruvate/2-oxoglutarate dehydrogenase complex dihydrolipoamide dehydrogenase (E3) component
MSYDYDLFTIGGGSGGVRGSRFAGDLGAKVACAELPFGYKSSETVGGLGGTCVLRGCVPKKLLLFCSEYASMFKDSVGFGYVPHVSFCCAGDRVHSSHVCLKVAQHSGVSAIICAVMPPCLQWPIQPAHAPWSCGKQGGMCI